MSRFLYLQMMLASLTVVFECLFYPKDFNFKFFSYWARSDLIYKTIHSYIVILYNGL